MSKENITPEHSRSDGVSSTTGVCCHPSVCLIIHGRDGLLGRVWYYSLDKNAFPLLERLGFHINGDICEATVMSGAPARAESSGFTIEW